MLKPLSFLQRFTIRGSNSLIRHSKWSLLVRTSHTLVLRHSRDLLSNCLLPCDSFFQAIQGVLRIVDICPQRSLMLLKERNVAFAKGTPQGVQCWDILFQSASGYAPTHQAEDARVIPVMDNVKGLGKSFAYSMQCAMQP